MTDDDLKAIEERVMRASSGPWRALRDGNQYVETSYLPAARIVAASRVEGLRRPYNPHRLQAFGFRPEEYETARFLDGDADFIAHAREDIPALIAEVRRLQGEVARAREEAIKESAKAMCNCYAGHVSKAHTVDCPALKVLKLKG